MMLITITVAASIILYVYSSGLLGSLQGAQPQSGQYTNQITLEFYDWSAAGTGDSTLHTLKLTLRNVGSGIANLAALYVAGVSVNLKSATSWSCLVSAATIITSTVTAMVPGSSCTATLTLPPTLTVTAGIAYVVKAVTKSGGVFSYSCIAGQSTGSVP